MLLSQTADAGREIRSNSVERHARQNAGEGSYKAFEGQPIFSKGLPGLAV